MNPNNMPPNNMAGFPQFPGQPPLPVGGMPPVPGFPPMMPSFAPGMPPMPMPMPPGPPPQTTYPPGQGPLADVAPVRAANGLLEVPDRSADSAHPAAPLTLNGLETAKYIEYWQQASDGAESLAGSDAVPFLSRAAKVSKGQLRRIWTLADHRDSGELDQDQFFIALRLVALAQRGAELSLGGLRNFTGIQLIPSIEAPPPPPPSPPPPAGLGGQPAPGAQGAQGFSWTIPADVATRFDNFFKSMLPRGASTLEGGPAVTFFSKSGLPRPTLKRIWQLSDLNRDGKLTSDEFRIAMHLVSSIRNGRLQADAMPAALDPSGPNWLRVAGEPDFMQQQQMAQTQIQQPPGMPMHPPGSPAAQSISSVGSPAIPRPPSAGLPSPQQEAPPPIIIPPPPPPAGAPPPVQSPSMPSQEALAAENERKQTEQMLQEMRKERAEMERQRREMEQLRTDMERMRTEQAQMAAAASAATRAPPPAAAPAAPGMAPPMSSPSVPLSGAQPAAPAAPPPPPPPSQPTPSAPIAPAISGVPDVLAQRLGLPTGAAGKASAPAPPAAPAPVRAPMAPAPASPKAGGAGVRSKPIDLGVDDDDLWDQPSPKASALKPQAKPKATATTVVDDDDDSDDDDDFWGTSGLGPKPALGAAGARKPANGAGSGGAGGAKGFGGSELDDWAF